jgi:hypothetical protein
MTHLARSTPSLASSQPARGLVRGLLRALNPHQILETIELRPRGAGYRSAGEPTAGRAAPEWLQYGASTLAMSCLGSARAWRLPLEVLPFEYYVSADGIVTLQAEVRRWREAQYKLCTSFDDGTRVETSTRRSAHLRSSKRFRRRVGAGLLLEDYDAHRQLVATLIACGKRPVAVSSLSEAVAIERRRWDAYAPLQLLEVFVGQYLFAPVVLVALPLLAAWLSGRFGVNTCDVAG